MRRPSVRSVKMGASVGLGTANRPNNAVRLLRGIACEWRLRPLRLRQVLVALGAFESGEAVAEPQDMA